MRVKLTARNIGTALRGYSGGQLQLWDTEVPGFFLRVRETARTFLYQYGPRDRRRLYVIGDLGEFDAEAAREVARACRKAYREGRDPAAEREQRRAMPTFGEWSEEYVKAVKTRKKSWKDDRRHLATARKRWKTRPLDAITTEDVRRLFDSLTAAGTPILANRWLASVRACLQAAWREDVIPANPAAKVRPNRENEPRQRVLTDDELARLIGAVEALEHPHIRAAFTLLITTGARLSEVLRARWEDLDVEAGQWRIPSPKAGRPQVVPLPRTTVAMLRGLPRVGPLIVPGHNRHDKPRFDLKKPWEALRDAAGLEDVHIHDLRRSYGARVAREAGLHVASKLLRHADVRVTERVYAPLGMGELKKATEKHSRGLAKVLDMAERKRKAGAR